MKKINSLTDLIAVITSLLAILGVVISFVMFQAAQDKMNAIQSYQIDTINGRLDRMEAKMDKYFSK